MRLALIGLMVAGFAMFLASLYRMFWAMMPTSGTSAFDTASLSLFPMVAAVVLLRAASSASFAPPARDG